MVPRGCFRQYQSAPPRAAPSPAPSPGAPARVVPLAGVVGAGFPPRPPAPSAATFMAYQRPSLPPSVAFARPAGPTGHGGLLPLPPPQARGGLARTPPWAKLTWVDRHGSVLLVSVMAQCYAVHWWPCCTVYKQQGSHRDAVSLCCRPFFRARRGNWWRSCYHSSGSLGG